MIKAMVVNLDWSTEKVKAMKWDLGWCWGSIVLLSWMNSGYIEWHFVCEEDNVKEKGMHINNDHLWEDFGQSNDNPARNTSCCGTLKLNSVALRGAALYPTKLMDL